MSYDRPNEQAEYGGGGRQGDNYYNNSNQSSGGGGGGGGGGDYGRQGGSEYNTGGGYGGGNNSGGGYGGGSNQGGGGYEGNDLSSAQQQAERHAGSSGDSGMFGSVLSHLQSNAGSIQQGGVDEGHMVQSHQAMYGGGGGGGQQGQQQHGSQALGAGAAMQALKMFSGGGGGGAGGGQNQFVGMAMAEASKLFDQQSGQGNVAPSASKQGAVQQAGEMAMKMYMKSQMGGGGSGLMGLASKFM